jgi:hypothetical protein
MQSGPQLLEALQTAAAKYVGDFFVYTIGEPMMDLMEHLMVDLGSETTSCNSDRFGTFFSLSIAWALQFGMDHGSIG